MSTIAPLLALVGGAVVLTAAQQAKQKREDQSHHQAILEVLNQRLLTPREFCIGCEGYMASDPEDWPKVVQQGFVWMARYRDTVQSIAGRATVRGGWRPSDCNADREGEGRSRHLCGWALDLEWQNRQVQRDVFRDFLIEIGAIDSDNNPIEFRNASGMTANRWGELVRAKTGWRQGVGLRMYAYGNLHIDLGCPEACGNCDPRRSDWLELQYG